MNAVARAVTVPVLRRSLADRTRSTVGWLAGIAALFVLVVYAYPSVRDAAGLERSMAELPASVQSLMGLGGGLSVTSPAGYLQSQLFANIWPLLLLVFAIGYAAAAIAGSEERGTLELVAAHPVARVRIALARFAGLVLLLALLCGAGTALLIGLAGQVDLDDGVGAGGFVAANVGVFALVLAHAALAFGVGAATGRRGLAIAVATLVAVAGFVFQGLARVAEPLEPLQAVSPWHWYLEASMLTEGFAPRPIALPLGLAAVFVAIGTVIFTRRDLR